MINIFLTIVCLLGVHNVLAENHDSNNHAHWHYYSDGVDRWPGLCKGAKQSPIDIVDSQVVFDTADELKLYNYDKLVEVQTENNGHTVVFVLHPEDDLHIMGGGLNGSFTLKQIHFHWMSEHTRNGKRSPLEAHFVHSLDRHRNCRSTDDEAQLERYHVLSVMYYLTEKRNENMSKVIGSLKQNSKVGTTHKIILNIRKLLPENTAEFYRYEGSLTTPNCAETVQWTIFKSGMPISVQQYEVIGDLETINGTKTINYRPTQNLNSRMVKFIKTKHSFNRNIYMESSANKCSLILELFLLIVTHNLFYYK